jgi:dihydrofolate synthase/folylpolyglutamate synthase
MTYSDAIGFLHDLRLHGCKLGLEHSLHLAKLAGNPQDHLRFIHVAGTNGKGSTCAMLESIYRSAGLRVGLYTSPHLVSFRERIQVNRNPITAEEVITGVTRLQSLVETFPTDHCPTFFEVVTVLALSHFAERSRDLVIWETGMGGRLDATNIVHPLASLITNIELDHERWLGSTRAEIAFEKAGIIKSDVPILTAAEAPEALEVIRRTAAERRAPLTVLPPGTAGEAGLQTDLKLPLRGPHQRRNAALAIATVNRLQQVLPVSPAQLQQGLTNVDWPGRMQRVRPRSGVEVVLDCAHNPSGMSALAQGLGIEYPGRRPAIVLGMLADKDYAGMVSLAASIAKRIVFVPVRSDRSVEPRALASAYAINRSDISVDCRASIAEALELLAHESFVVITGSLYLVGEAMETLGLVSALDVQEHSLNDWSPAAAGAVENPLRPTIPRPLQPVQGRTTAR